MRQILPALIFISFLLFACSKDHDKASITTIPQEFQKHWIFDSIYNIYPDRGDTGIADYNDGQYEEFTDTTWVNYSLILGKQVFSASFQSPSKIFYWQSPYSQDDSNYITVKSVTATNLVLQRTSGNPSYRYTVTKFYHAQ